MGANWIVSLVVVIYLLAMLFIGWYSSTSAFGKFRRAQIAPLSDLFY